jgi:hypothetical protein
MYNFQDDSEKVKQNSPGTEYVNRVLGGRARKTVNRLQSFLEQGYTFRDDGKKRKYFKVFDRSDFCKNRIDIAGNRVTITEYEKPVPRNLAHKETGSNRGKSANREKNQKDSARRAKSTFVDKVDSTFAFIDKKFPTLFDQGWRLRFLTLTYREPMEGRDRLAHDWEKFVKRVETYFVSAGLCSKAELKAIHYIAVPEIQKERERKTGKRVWHLHVLIFSPYLSIREIYKVWGFGGLLPKKVDLDKIKSLGGYLAKYMDKDFHESVFNKKRFFSSRNVRLYKVRIMENVEHVKNILAMFKRYAVDEKPFYYKSEWFGMISGCVLVLARTEEVYQFLKLWTG